MFGSKEFKELQTQSELYNNSIELKNYGDQYKVADKLIPLIHSLLGDLLMNLRIIQQNEMVHKKKKIK